MQTWIHPSVRQGGSLLMHLWLIDYKGSRSLIKYGIEKERLAQAHQVWYRVWYGGYSMDLMDLIAYRAFNDASLQ